MRASLAANAAQMSLNARAEQISAPLPGRASIKPQQVLPELFERNAPFDHPLASSANFRIALGDVAEFGRPECSLMPRKEDLRREQRGLLKQTEVVHYRGAMEMHLRKILETVELTFNDTTQQRQQPGLSAWNLAKPLSNPEIKHLHSIAIPQPS